ncbi:MAG: flagellar basal body P-ring formation chaperone FlgA [Pseudomonadota bacterium]
MKVRAKLQSTESVFTRAMRIAALGIVLALLLPVADASSTVHEEVEDIKSQVTDFMNAYDYGSGLEVTTRLGKIDPRLRLARCTTPLEIEFVGAADRPGRTFLGVGCSATEKPWTIYVNALIQMRTEAYVTRTALLRGQIVQRSDITTEMIDLGNLRSGYFTSADQLIGMESSRAISAGTVLTPNLLKARQVVRRGQVVTLIASVGGIDVRMKGQAMADAARDTPVRVKNSSSGRIVEGIAESVGVVRIPM